MVNHADSGFVMLCSALVLMMTLPGIALYYTGVLVDPRAARSQTMAVAAVAILMWVTFGFDFTFGSDDDIRAVSNGLSRDVFEIFQLTFAVITPCLLVGFLGQGYKPGVAGAVLKTLLWSLAVYYPVAQQTWSDFGVFHRLGVLDFAGGLVVHITTGFTALTWWYLYGKVQPCSLDGVWKFLGGSLLVVGWIGFNGGSALAADEHAATAVLNSISAASIGAMAYAIRTGGEELARDASGPLIDGAIAGLVAITPICGYVDTGVAIALGMCAGYLSGLASGIGDGAGIFSVHGVSGVVGAIGVGIFATQKVYGGDHDLGLVDGSGWLLVCQFFAVTMVAGWSVVMATMIWAIDVLLGWVIAAADEHL